MLTNTHFWATKSCRHEATAQFDRFDTDDLASFAERVQSEAATVLDGPLNNPLAQH